MNVADLQTSQDINYSDEAIHWMNKRNVSQENRTLFLEVLQKTTGLTPQNAHEELSSLTEDEKEAVRVVHGLADSFYINGLSEEGAYNLLCQPGSEKDLDNNGFLSIGAGLCFSFPPPNAPDSVKKAWDETMQGKSDGEKLMMMAVFLPLELQANLKYDSNHQVVGFYEPTEPGYTNIYAQPGFSYQGLVKKYLQYLENIRYSLSVEDYSSKKNIMNDFLQNLVKNDAD